MRRSLNPGALMWLYVGSFEFSALAEQAYGVTGALAGAAPEAGAGYRLYFGLLAGIAVAGLMATAALIRRENR